MTTSAEATAAMRSELLRIENDLGMLTAKVDFIIARAREIKEKLRGDDDRIIYPDLVGCILHSLNRADIYTWHELAACTAERLQRMRHIASMRVDEIRRQLGKRGLALVGEKVWTEGRRP